ncbi:MAG: adenosylcobinamide-GDP ribazoletransferase [Crocinitomicaceae bacterium]|nr:adenosylcobinamide-GDP ribazoletransferase [Crocinitomicaceae bacterium]
MKDEFQTFLNALQFYTRIPLGKLVKYTPKRLENSIRYFPIIGIIVGGMTSVSVIFFDGLVGTLSAVIIGLLVGVLITGALHEDGLADCCDGFGGGWTKDRVLAIMKDSTIGVYGAIGLIFLFTLKVSFLWQLYTLSSHCVFIYSIVLTQVVSRSTTGLIMLFLDYARSDDSSKSSGVAKRLSFFNTIMLLGITGLTFGADHWFLIGPKMLWMLPILVVLMFLLGFYFKRRIGGYTGDCLGMAQQLSELVIYGTFVALWS